MGKQTQEPTTRPWWVDAAADLLLATMFAAGLAWWQYETYRVAAPLQPLLLPQLWRLLWLLTASILPTALMLWLACALLAAIGWRRVESVALPLGLGLYLLWFSADAQVHLTTGRRLASYLVYLTQPDVGEWAGGTGEILRGALQPAAISLAVAAVVWGYRLVLRRSLSARAGRARYACCGAIVLVAALAMLGRIQYAHAADGSSELGDAMRRMDATAEATLEQRLALSPFGTEFSRLARPMLEPIHERLFEPAPTPTVEALDRPNPPDIVIVVLESLRHTVLDTGLMPEMRDLSRRGLVSRRHYSPSNRSEYGLFGILYGQSPARYDRTLDRRVPPVLCQILRRWGYRSIYLSGLRHEGFQRMDEFLHADGAFDEVVSQGKESWGEDLFDGDWPARDRAALEMARARLGETDRPPLMIMLFLGSTHFPYRYPPEYERHMPVVSEEGIWVGLKERKYGPGLNNRYANAANFLDDELARFVRDLDLSRTVLLVTGDHGESLGEDGVLMHASRPSDIQCRVPFLIVGAGMSPREEPGPSTHLDVMPTLLHAVAGRPVAPGAFRGRDLLADAPAPEWVLLGWSSREGPQELALIAPEGRMMLRLMDRKPVARFLGVVGSDGAVNPALTPPAERAADWVRRWGEALGRHAGELRPAAVASP